jgi:Flp pilus assembly pilin Flp
MELPKMTSLLLNFLANDQAQDMVEYSLLIAFVFFTIMGLVVGMGDSVHTITSISTSQLSAADAMVR